MTVRQTVNIKTLAILTCSCILHFTLVAQKNGLDTTKNNNDIFQLLMRAIHRDPSDSAKTAHILNAKSEDAFKPYKGKIIRHIFIKEYGFERNFDDTSKQSPRLGARLLNSLHRNSREWVIRDNLFVRENLPLNPDVVADNERFLRSLEYIQDARILVKPISDEQDSVDLFVITKDLFSITGELNDANPHRFKAKLGDVNVAGMGQTGFFTGLIEKDRNPGFGYDVFYSKKNIAHSFIDLSADYSTIHHDLSHAGLEDEKGWYIQLSRPLVSQFTHFAGGVSYTHNESHNSYNLPDSAFYKYHNNIFDGWVGYNLGVTQLMGNEFKARKFVSIRYFKDKFTLRPFQADGHYSFRYDDRQAVLAGFTFFRQRFYKTNYIFGFGTTEDIPYGYNLALSTGWYKQADLNRYYIGIDANKYIVTNSAFFIQYYLRAGTFVRKHNLEDANVLLGGSMYSKLFLYRNVKIRQYFNASYTRQFDRLGLEPLTINNAFGVRYFRSDSAVGTERISLYSETFLFLKNTLLGFKFSPFFFGNISLLKPEEGPISRSNAYYGIGGGLRTRNENLVFGTIELRFAYFPRKIDQNSFKLTLSANLTFKFNSTYVKEPDIMDVNNNVNNEIY